jgi:predicted aspartyl protease
MPLHRGFFDEAGQPRVRVTVHGDLADVELEPIFDTGFTDFFAMPAGLARRLGIRPYGRSSFSLADGSTISMPTAAGRIELSPSETYRGIIILTEDEDALLGMEFLRVARRALYVDRKSVVLMDEAEGEKLR